MAYAYPLVSLDEALRELKQENSTEAEVQRVNDALDQASAEIIGYLGWKLSPADNWIEYHQAPRTGAHELHLRHFEGGPTFAVTEIAEDSSRTYGASSLLTVATDYVVGDRGVITRLSGSSPTTWLSGYEAIRVKVTAGYAVEDVPPEVKRICRTHLARLYNASVREEHGFSVTSDATGTVTRYGPPKLYDWMMSAMVEHKLHFTTCQRYEEA